MKKKIQVFLSYKYHGENGEILPDYYMAKEIYDRLQDIGINTFFSDVTIMKAGQSDYKRLIDSYLDEAEMLIVVSTSPEYCNSNWVRYEWDSFYNDILSEKKKGELISYLDTDDIRSFPRTIRTLQVFEKNANGLEALVMFVKAYFNVMDSEDEMLASQKGSSYNYENTYELGDERKRLAIQAKVESCRDSMYIADLLNDENKKYNILDVGCSMGAVTFDVFGVYEKRINVLLGVDKFKKCVEGFNESTPYDNMRAELVNFENEGWSQELEGYMKQYDIKKFDLVYCSLSLHHMSDSKGVIKKLWNYVSENGYIYVRTCDDALKLAYPNGEYVYEIINRTASVPHASDRFHGRKIYSMLYNAKFKNIKMKSFLIDTGDKDIEERYALYYSAFVWRKNYFKNRLNSATTQDEIESSMKAYNEVMELLDKIENMFMDKSFYFGYYVTIAIGQKKKMFDF